MLKAEGVNGLSRETARAWRVSESLPALQRMVMAEATRRPGSPISLDLFTTADNTLVHRFFARHPEPLAEGADALAHRTAAGLVAAAGSCTASVSSLSALRYLAGVRGEGALGRHAWVRRRSVHAI